MAYDRVHTYVHTQNRRHLKLVVDDRLLYCSVASYAVRYDRKKLVAVCVPLVKAVPMSMPAHKHLITSFREMLYSTGMSVVDRQAIQPPV